MRLSSGMNPEQAISRQVGPKTYQFQGQNLTARAIAAKAGIPHNSLLRRIKRHGSVVAAIAHWKANGRGKKTGRSSAPMTRRTER
ncbi:MAG TPA: hypothetical protein VFR23_24440 [Jiangellaceae bacterium]|nr:hypothetical protein [Jiangellaceae bacterium]